MDNIPSKETVLMSAAQYFLSRKKYIDGVVEGEHKWFGDVSYTQEFNSRPWYLEADGVSKPHSGS